MVGSIEVLGLLLALGLCFVADCVCLCVCVSMTVTGSIFWVLCFPLSRSLFWACVGLLGAECIYKYAAAFVARELLPCLLCPSNYALSSLEAWLGVGGWFERVVGRLDGAEIALR